MLGKSEAPPPPLTKQNICLSRLPPSHENFNFRPRLISSAQLSSGVSPTPPTIFTLIDLIISRTKPTGIFPDRGGDLSSPAYPVRFIVTSRAGQCIKPGLFLRYLLKSITYAHYIIITLASADRTVVSCEYWECNVFSQCHVCHFMLMAHSSHVLWCVLHVPSI